MPDLPGLDRLLVRLRSAVVLGNTEAILAVAEELERTGSARGPDIEGQAMVQIAALIRRMNIDLVRLLFSPNPSVTDPLEN